MRKAEGGGDYRGAEDYKGRSHVRKTGQQEVGVCVFQHQHLLRTQGKWAHPACLWGPLGLKLVLEGRNWCFVGLGLSGGLRSFLGLSLHPHKPVSGRLDLHYYTLCSSALQVNSAYSHPVSHQPWPFLHPQSYQCHKSCVSNLIPTFSATLFYVV